MWIFFFFLIVANVIATNITLDSAIIQFTVDAIFEQQQYTIRYGTDPSDLSTVIGPFSSPDPPQTNLTFEQALSGLLQGTTYYVQVSSTFGIYNLNSDIVSFTTLEPGIILTMYLWCNNHFIVVILLFPVPQGPPLDFTIVASGTTLAFSWSRPLGNEVIVSFRLSCNSSINLEFNNINTITLYDLIPETTFACTLEAASSSGYGPSTDIVYATTEGMYTPHC